MLRWATEVCDEVNYVDLTFELVPMTSDVTTSLGRDRNLTHLVITPSTIHCHSFNMSIISIVSKATAPLKTRSMEAQQTDYRPYDNEFALLTQTFRECQENLLQAFDACWESYTAHEGITPLGRISELIPPALWNAIVHFVREKIKEKTSPHDLNEVENLCKADQTN